MRPPARTQMRFGDLYPSRPLLEAWFSPGQLLYAHGSCKEADICSPEIHPSHPSAPDLSLYFFDPRETYLRRSRDTTPQQDVWTGKGLVSWALAEPGDGKNLITGRVVRSQTFSTPPSTEMSGLEALLAAGSEPTETWGIEVAVALKSGAGGSLGMAVSQVAQISDKSSSTAADRSRSETHAVPTLPRRRPLSPSRTVAANTPVTQSSPSVARSTSSGKRKSHKRRHDPRKPSAAAGPSRPFIDDIPSYIYENPELLTHAQAERLAQSPAFIARLEKVLGPLKRGREDNAGREESFKTAKVAAGTKELKCYNCGRTKSAVWRQKVMEDGVAVRVCNGRLWRSRFSDLDLLAACGLYWNKQRIMRPPSLWEGVNDDVEGRLGVRKSQSDAVSSSAAHFKRTLSGAANKDAARIAALRSLPNRRPIATSPVRITRATASTIATARPPVVSASSPGPSTQNTAASPTPNESPNTAIRRFLLSDAFTSIPPSSDIPAASSSTGIDWSSDLSALFDFNTVVPSEAQSDYSQLFTDDPLTTEFDFSKLPPSSPPALAHSALLLSSPDLSESGLSISPATALDHASVPSEKSRLKQSFTPDTFTKLDTIPEGSVGSDAEPPAGVLADLDLDAIQQMLDRFSEQSFQGDQGDLMRLLAGFESGTA